jgi:hypothetical protein
MLLPFEQELVQSNVTTLEGLVAQYRFLFHTCWETMTQQQQNDVNEILVTAGLIPAVIIDNEE